MRGPLIPLLLLAIPLPAAAQRTDSQLWLAATATIDLGGKARLTIESIGRSGDRAAGVANAQIGAALRVEIARGVEAGAGYRHVQDFDHGRALPNEERMRQHVAFVLARGLTTRWMIEERFQSSAGGIGVRLRPHIRFTLPLATKGPVLFAWHEDFVNLNTTRWGQRAGYERTRQSIGIGVPLAKRLSAEIGYLNQYRFGRRGARDQMDHIANLSLSLGL